MTQASIPTDEQVFTDEELADFDKTLSPQHIAIIPDGNRRWAVENGHELFEGHRQGTQSVLNAVKAAAQLGVKTLTLYTFSTENWQRPKHEVDFLMELLQANILDYTRRMADRGARLQTIGDLSALPEPVQMLIAQAKEETRDGQLIDLVLAINYGARDELRRVCQGLAQKCVEGTLKPEAISEELIAENLDTHPWGDPELFIRTSGELRISNFLLWQLSYSELYAPKKYWPEFGPHDLLAAVSDFQRRKRRFGS